MNKKKTSSKAGSDQIKQNDSSLEEKKGTQVKNSHIFYQIIGEIVTLCSQSNAHRNIFISELECRVLPGILNKQFRIYRDKDRVVAAVFWAVVNNEVDQRISAGEFKLQPHEWTSGKDSDSIVWLIDIISPFGNHEKIIDSLVQKEFKDQKFKFRKFVNGQLEIATINPSKN